MQDRRSGMDTTLLRGPLAWTLADSLLDRPALWTILRFWLPLSRAWAAAVASRGDTDRFIAEAPLAGDVPRTLPGRLAAFESVRRTHDAAEQEWLGAMFAGSSSDGLGEVDRRRNRAALRLAAQRLRFVDLAWTRRIPALRFAIPSPAETEQAYGRFVDSPARAYLPSHAPDIAVSHRIAGKRSDRYWLRFESTSARIPGAVFARVSEPRGIANPPTLIFANGISVESDFDALMPERAAAMGRRDVRVIEIESPWHGRRRKAGCYGGEPFLGAAPLGPIDLFSTEAQDMAVLVEWCRQTSSGNVVLAGASMGSLVVTLAASHCAHWPQGMRPDGLLLLTAVDDVGRLEQASALTTGIGLTSALAASGWSNEALARWHPFVAAASAAPLPPESIVVVLGARDTVLPFSSGFDLAQRWKIPRDNLFVAESGHFSSQGAGLLDRRAARRVSALLGRPSGP
jgi:hypothetical protein